MSFLDDLLEKVLSLKISDKIKFYDFVKIKYFKADEEKISEGNFRSKEVRKLFQNELKKLSYEFPSEITYKTKIEGVEWSFSHTKGAVIVGIVPLREFPACQSIGVDIEHETRKIPTILNNKFSHLNDIKIDELEKWIIKEAVFKCVSKIFYENFDLKDICITTEDTFSFDKHKQICGQYQIWKESEFIISMAMVVL